MGSASRPKPERLAEKLLAIRKTLNLDQVELASQLSDKKISLRKSDISRYESGLREPPSVVLLRYSRLAHFNVEKLIDDKLDLPVRFTRR
jgi:transcriptional regulator with XRE-family HTH domain